MKQLTVQARPGGAEILIFGPIGDEGPLRRSTATADAVKSKLDALGNVAEITVRINSPGGNFFEGVAIYNLLRNHRATVIVRIEGLAASAASIIAMAGDTVIMADGAFLMIHRASMAPDGTGDDLRAAADVLDEIDEQMAAIYAQRTSIPKKRLLELMGAETWLTAADAVKQGFADELERAIAASIDLTYFAKAPQEIAEMAHRIAASVAANAAPPATADASAVLAAERTRRTEIRARFGTRYAEDHSTLLDECLDDPAITVTAASTRLLDALAMSQPRISGMHHSSTHHALPSSAAPGTDDFIAAASDALLLRAGIRIKEPHAAARDVARMSLQDIARVCVDNSPRAASIWKRERDVIRAAATTSDFPLILEDAINKALRNGFENEPASHRQWVRVQPVTDFKEQKRPILGSAPDLKPVVEHGEYTHGYFAEDGTGYHVTKFGRIVALSWEALKNDDLGVFLQRIPPALGQAARRLEADKVYALLALNSAAGPAMQDGVNLFHADHKNLASAQGALDKDALAAGRLLLRKQTAVGGGLLSLVPRYLIVPAELETDAEILIAAATVHRSGIDENETAGTASAIRDVSTTTPEWISRLELVVEPRLAATAFYLATSSDQVDHCELGVLEENMSGPMLFQEEGFNIDSMSWKARHVFAPKFLDWRGMVKVPI